MDTIIGGRLFETPNKHIKLLIWDFNSQIEKENKFRKIVGKFSAHERTNYNGERLIETCELFSMKLILTQFRKYVKKT